MKLPLIVLLLVTVVPIRAPAQTNAASAMPPSQRSVETLVCIRHAEKPAAGLGQLACRGLNRALALPKVLLGKFGAPQFIFAPNPSEKSESGKYFYLRPLATIEPTAIRCELPVNTHFGFRDIQGLETELAKASYHNATVFVAWEHSLLDQFAKDEMKSHGGDISKVPVWRGDDFDSIFVIKITRDKGRETIDFTIDHEGLNNLSDECP